MKNEIRDASFALAFVTISLAIGILMGSCLSPNAASPADEDAITAAAAVYNAVEAGALVKVDPPSYRRVSQKTVYTAGPIVSETNYGGAASFTISAKTETVEEFEFPIGQVAP